LAKIIADCRLPIADWQLPIANCEFEERVQKQIGNWQSAIGNCIKA